MAAYYNEIDPYAAQWLRNLIAAGHIAAGDVDERSIVDVRASDLAGFTQCHFFAGIGVWSYALRQAGWPDDKPVWTGSCPCQSFSAAGSGGGFNDERHLWPDWFRLIGECKPGSVFGEQVASKDGIAWLDFVCADMEGANYAIAPLDLCAAGFGAPHIRQRLYFVAHAAVHGHIAADGLREALESSEPSGANSIGQLAGGGDAGGGEFGLLAQGGGVGILDDTQRDGRRTRWDDDTGNDGIVADAAIEPRYKPGPTNGFWADAEWHPCRDGKARPAKPGIFPLAHGAPSRVGRLRAYGNGLCAAQATEFIRAASE